MDPSLDVDSFLKSANCDLRVALENYQSVVTKVQRFGNNTNLEEKRKKIEEEIVRIGLKEKRYFNEMRRFPNVYQRITRRRNIMDMEYANKVAHQESEGSIPKNPLDDNGIGIEENVLKPTVKEGNADDPLEASVLYKHEHSPQEIAEPETEQRAHPSQTMDQEQFLLLFNLVPTASVSQLRKKRAERKKRSTEDSQFIYESCVGKEAKSDTDIDVDDKPVAPPKLCRKRGRPKIRHIVPMPTIAEEPSDLTSPVLSIKSNSSKKNPVKKRGRPRIKPIKLVSKMLNLVPSQTLDCIEDVSASESSSNNSAINKLKEPQAQPDHPTNDRSEPAVKAQIDIPLPSNILPKCMFGFLKHVPGTSTASECPQYETVTHTDCSDTKVLPFILYQKLPKAGGITLAGSPPVSGQSSQSSAEQTVTNVVCKSCLNNYPVLVDDTTEFKCPQCRDVQASGTNQNAPPAEPSKPKH